MDRLERAFELLEQCAAEGLRCPMSNGPSTHLALENGEIGKLCRAGRIRCEVYRWNYRVIVILKGPHKGKHTKLPEGDIKPWKITGTEVTRRDTKAQRRRDAAFPMPKYKCLEKPIKDEA